MRDLYVVSRETSRLVHRLPGWSDPRNTAPAIFCSVLRRKLSQTGWRAPLLVIGEFLSYSVAPTPWRERRHTQLLEGSESGRPPTRPGVCSPRVSVSVPPHRSRTVCASCLTDCPLAERPCWTCRPRRQISHGLGTTHLRCGRSRHVRGRAQSSASGPYVNWREKRGLPSTTIPHCSCEHISSPCGHPWDTADPGGSGRYRQWCLSLGFSVSGKCDRVVIMPNK